MKKVLTIIISIALVAAVAVGGTLAYLSSTASDTELTNTFTTTTPGSKLDITLFEHEVDKDTGRNLTGAEWVTKNNYPIIPGAIMDKDPTVTVKANSSPCYVFVYVKDDATLNGKNAADIGQINSNWVAVDDDSYPGLYAYKSGDVVPTSTADEVLPAVFTSITINKDLTVADTAHTPQGEISVKAYAYQASAGVTYDDAKTAAINLFFPANP